MNKTRKLNVLDNMLDISAKLAIAGAIIWTGTALKYIMTDINHTQNKMTYSPT